jgi:hypothetical protein
MNIDKKSPATKDRANSKERIWDAYQAAFAAQGVI